jgi:hypothetical protein
MKRRTFVTAALCLVPAGAGIGYWELPLRFLPNGLNVWRVLFSKQESSGFGPGANESGLILYALPEDKAVQISRSGIAFFNRLPVEAKENPGDWEGVYP